MKRSQRRPAVCVLAFAAALVTEPAAAQGVAGEPTRLELRAPAGCSSAEDFAARVARRSNRIHFVSEKAHRSLVVELAASGQGLRGSVTLIEADGATRRRTLAAKTCEEAAEGLALIATVTLDPDALSADPEPAPSESSSARPDEPQPPRDEPTPKPQLAPPGRSLATADAALRFSFGVAAAVMVEMAPEPALGASLEVALELNPGKLWSPFFRLSVPHAQRRDVQRGVGSANFAFTLPTLDVCPVRLGSAALALRPCASASAGLLEVWGSADALANEAHSRLFAAVGGALWAGLRVSKVIDIIADVRAVAPLRRDSFAFDDAVFWRTPPLGFSSVLGIAGGFP